MSTTLIPPSSTSEALPHQALPALVASVRQIAMQRDLLGVSTVAAQTVTGLAGGARGYFYFFDAETSMLWDDEGFEVSAQYGMAGIAARSRVARIAHRAAHDPAYVHSVDDREGTGAERLLAQPIVSPGGEVHAVVVVVRHASLDPFSSTEIALVALWAAQVAPLLNMLHLESEAHSAHFAAEVVGLDSIYRQDALAHVAGGNLNMGPLVGTVPWFLRHAYLLAIVGLILAVGFVGFVPVNEYARGPAVVVSTGVHDISTSRDGVVEALEVRPGDVVEEGQILARLSADAERAELARAEAELERIVHTRLRRPAQDGLDVEVARARVARDRAAAQVETTLIRSRVTGRVGDHRVDVGRSVAAGEVVMTVLRSQHGNPIVRALVPGRHRPALEVGQPVTLDLDGFSDGKQRLVVSAIHEEVVGATEMRRIAGAQIADALALDGPAAVIEMRLDDDTISAGGRTWVVREGMTGRAFVSVRRRPILLLLFPEIERLLDHV